MSAEKLKKWPDWMKGGTSRQPASAENLNADYREVTKRLAQNSSNTSR